MSKYVAGFRLKAAAHPAAIKQLRALGFKIKPTAVSTTFTGRGAFTGFAIDQMWSVEAGAYTESRDGLSGVINYPALNDGALVARAEADLIAAYTLHEIGHMAFSRDQGKGAARNKHGRLGHLVWNGLEDPRIEAAIINAGISGARKLFRALLTKETNKIGAEWNPTNINHAPFALAVLGRAAFGNGNAFANALLARIPEPKRSIYAKALDGMAALPLNRAGSLALYDVVDEFLAAWKAADDYEPESEAPPANPSQPSDDGADADPMPSDTEGDEDGEGDGFDFADEGGEFEDTEDGGDAMSFGGEDEDAETPDDDGADIEEDGGILSGGGSDAEDDESSDGAPSPEAKFAEAAAPLNEAELKSPEPDINEVFGRANLRGDTETIDSAPRATYSDASAWNWKDRSEKAERAAVRKLAKNQYGALKSQLVRMFRAPEVTGWDGGMSAGRFDRRRISKMLAGAESVFKKRWTTEGVETAVTVLVDLSGSMKGEPAKLASQIAFAIADAAEGANTTVQVLGFRDRYNTPVTSGRDIEGQYVNAKFDVGATAQLAIFKRYNQRVAAAAPILTRMHAIAEGGTPDYTALKTVVEDMSLRPEARKVVVVLTDGVGYAASMPKLQRFAERVLGVDVVGIGIGFCGEEYFRSVYPVGEVAPRLEDLAGVTLKRLNKVLDKRLAGRRAM